VSLCHRGSRYERSEAGKHPMSATQSTHNTHTFNGDFQAQRDQLLGNTFNTGGNSYFNPLVIQSLRIVFSILHPPHRTTRSETNDIGDNLPGAQPHIRLYRNVPHRHAASFRVEDEDEIAQGTLPEILSRTRESIQ